jgi:hypothetical protein
VHADIPGKHKSHLHWTSDRSWTIRQRYLRDTLTTSVSLDNKDLKLALYCNDVVDFHRAIHVRKIKIKNLAHHDRTVRIMHHQDFNMFGHEGGRHRLLRSGAQVDRPLPQQAVHHGDVLHHG